MSAARRAFIGLGSNLGDRRRHLAAAVAGLPDVVAVSPLYETDPVGGPSGQDPYLNAVVELRTERTPRQLLDVARALEVAAGRVRTVRWGPRTLDVDILLVGDLVCDEPDLVVPHPRLRERAFVLVPLADLAPDVVGARPDGLAHGVRPAGTLSGPAMAFAPPPPAQPELIVVPDEWRRVLDERRAELGAGRPAAAGGAFSPPAPVVGLVPTMGALHAGHLSMIRRARAECAVVAVTDYVNPLQFGAAEDLASYPRDLDRDLRLAGEAGADLVFAPAPAALWPDGPPVTAVSVAGLSEGLEGAVRPGHFQGVATIVAKLLALSGPCCAYFGEKDFQQLAVVRRLVADLSLPTAVVACPTVRDPDGLALSSRNVYLTAEERAAAPVFYHALLAGRRAIEDDGARQGDVVRRAMRRSLEAAGLVEADYAEVVDPATMGPLDELAGDVRLLVAGRLGATRLIDNIGVAVPERRSGAGDR